MARKSLLLISIVVILGGTQCKNTQLSMAPQPEETQRMVLISTNLGDIKFVLYDETPQHRDNFIKLVEDSFYNGSVFHRVIRDFMIQGGGAPAGKEDLTYTIPAEFNPALYHKKGAIAAARLGDQVNPQKASSPSQFYIVQGKPVPESQLDGFSARSGITYSPEQRETYAQLGGTPHLDGGYTVFGEVIEGLEIIDLIAAVPTAAGDRPVNKVTMTMKMLN